MNTPAVICDLDGTLALFKEKGHRTPFEYEKVGEDELNEPVAEIVRAMHDKLHYATKERKD